jgi:hypothetical protein
MLLGREDPIKWLNDYSGRYNCNKSRIYSRRIAEIEGTETIDGGLLAAQYFV